MSSHREAPEISKDPVADNTDLYAFVSPDRPDTVTIITNYIPLQAPDGGPNFYEFGDDVLYEIHIDNDGDAEPDITYQFRFSTEIRNTNTFLYNTGQITSLSDQPGTAADLHRHPDRPGRHEGARHGLPVPPCNIGPRSTPNYAALADAGDAHDPERRDRVRRTARARASTSISARIFDLGKLRPVPAPAPDPDPRPRTASNGSQELNVHTIAIQVPINDLTRDGHRADRRRSTATRSSACGRRRSRAGAHRSTRPDGPHVEHGPWVQVSRLGNPLFNEVIVPMAEKDYWNARSTPATTRSSRSTSRIRSWPGCCRCSTRACSRTWRPTRSRPRRPAGHPADRHPRRASSPGSRTSPVPRRRTCCA